MVRNIQLVRALGACLVVLHHLKPHYDALAGHATALGTAMEWGFAGVDLFFVVSGYIMMQLVAGREPTWPALRRFAIHRLVRIYSWYLPCLAFAAIVMWHFQPSVWATISVVDSIFLTTDRSARHVIPAAWSLAYELYFYALVAVLWAIGRQRLQGPLIALTALAAGAGVGGWFADGTFGYFATSPFLLEFAAGALVSLHRERLARTGWSPVLLLVAAVGVLGWGMLSIDARHNFHRALVFGTAAACVVAALVALEDRGRFRAGPLAVAVGDASYSIYLLHLPLLTLFYFGGVRDALAALPLPQGSLLLAVLFALFIAACVVIHRKLERRWFDLLCAVAGAGRTGPAREGAARPAWQPSSGVGPIGR